MSKCQSGVDVICPFYRKNSKESITCEGMIPDTRCMHSFRSAPERAKHMGIFCGAMYRNCEAYAAIMEKYEGDADEQMV